jgi:imidazole glycerol-phosphate synthase subunit HisF
MRNIRLIARLDIKSSNLIKSINLEGLKIVGDPNTFAKKYYHEGLDELIFMDCVATLYGRNNLSDIIKTASKNVFIPITVGGGIRNLEDAKKILNCGADKVAVNTAAVKNPNFISELASSIGSQSVVLSIEAKKRENQHWEVYTSNGRDQTGLDVFQWIKKATSLGVGEILLTSVDREGTKKGFDIELMSMASKLTDIPIIASGGLGQTKHLSDLINLGNIDAIAVADAIHYGRIPISELKNTISKNQ